MVTNKYEGVSLPFTSHNWTRQFKSGTFRNGASWRHVEKVKVLGRGTMGAKLEEVHVLASWDVDIGGNKTVNLRKGQHSLSLKKGAEELAFAISVKSGWVVIAYDCSYCTVVKTQKDAESILKATNWRRWKNRKEENKNVCEAKPSGT